jgi:hypothetical protein
MEGFLEPQMSGEFPIFNQPFRHAGFFSGMNSDTDNGQDKIGHSLRCPDEFPTIIIERTASEMETMR